MCASACVCVCVSFLYLRVHMRMCDRPAQSDCHLFSYPCICLSELGFRRREGMRADTAHLQLVARFCRCDPFHKSRETGTDFSFRGW